MKGCKPLPYRLQEADRHVIETLLADGHLPQRVANRAQALLALDRGERIHAIGHWLGWSRTGLWHLWHRYQQWGVDAVFDAARRGHRC